MSEKDVTEFVKEVKEKGDFSKNKDKKKNGLMKLFSTKEESDNDRLSNIEQQINELSDRLDQVIQDFISPDEKDVEVKQIKAELKNMVERNDLFKHDLLTSISKASLSDMEKETFKKMIKSFDLSQ